MVRRELGRRLRALRLAAGKDILEVSQALLGSKAKMSRIENGLQPIRIADVIALCEFYGADPRTTSALRMLAPGTQQIDWWEPELGSIPGWFGLYVGLESTAIRIRYFEPQSIPGVLQTKAYARAITACDPSLSPEAVEQRVRFRMERQLRSMDGVSMVIGEGALRLAVGSPEVMAEQLRHLRDSAADIRVLPFAAGPTPLRSSWAMLEFEDPRDPAVVYVEGAGIARYLDRPRDWARYETVWKMVVDRSVPIGEWLDDNAMDQGLRQR